MGDISERQIRLVLVVGEVAGAIFLHAKFVEVWSSGRSHGRYFCTPNLLFLVVAEVSSVLWRRPPRCRVTAGGGLLDAEKRRLRLRR